MFKNSVLLFLIFSSISLFSQDDYARLEVKYQMKFIPDSTNKNVAHYAEVSLLCNEEKSIYFSRDAKVYYDYLYKKTNEMIGGRINLGSLPAYPKVRGSVFRDGASIIATLPVGKYNYSFVEPELKWTLMKEEKTINGMRCNLAKTETENGDTFFAWYAVQYPFQEGPFRFKNLPGLIIQIYNKNHTITINATEIKKSTEKIEPLSLGRVIRLETKEAFLEARKNYYENPNINTFNDDIIIKDDRGTDYAKRRKESLKSQNVFLD